MAEIIMSSIFQIKRAQSIVWATKNPVLRIGEPGYELDTNRLKVGDGVSTWNSLEYIGEGNVLNFANKELFPAAGYPNVLYKAEDECALYQWNTRTLIYEKLSGDSSLEDIEVIRGGNAYGINT